MTTTPDHTTRDVPLQVGDSVRYDSTGETGEVIAVGTMREMFPDHEWQTPELADVGPIYRCELGRYKTVRHLPGEVLTRIGF